MATEQRVSRLEGAYEQVDRRLDSMEQSVNGLRSDTNIGMSSLCAEMNSRFNTLYVIMGAYWVTLLGAIIGLYFK